MSNALGEMMGDSSLSFTQCPLANVSVCQATGAQEGFMMVVYNPSSARRVGMWSL